MKTIMIRTSDIFENKSSQFSTCLFKAKKYKIYDKIQINGNTLKLYLAGRKLDMMKYYATTFSRDDGLLNGLRRLLSITFTF